MTYEEALNRFKRTYERIKDYYDPHWEGSEYREHREWVEQIETAISALEKQIPKKPKRINKNSVFDGNWKMICPRCGVTLVERITTENTSYPIQYNMTKHCECGQSLDWSDTK